MAVTTLTGSRVRERRIALGLRQADVARLAGVSPSYLNLIEHNRRRIGLAVLERLASALAVPIEGLEGGAAAGLAEELRGAAADDAGARAELEAVEEFVGRFPGWAGLLASEHRRAERLMRAVEALNDRISHDPHLSAALHEMLSAVSAVRSVAGILAETPDIEPEWRLRFHHNLQADSERLAAGAEALVAYLDGTAEAQDEAVASAQDEVEAWLAARDWQFGAEAGGAAEGLASSAARALAADLVAQAAQDGRVLPEAEFAAAVARLGPDPALLAAEFGVPMLAVFRRLALWPGSRLGLVVCDASGTLVFRKPADGFSVPRYGAACGLWPLYTALGSPMRPVVARVEVAGRGGRRFGIRAFCEPRFPAGFEGVELRMAAMLILPEEAGGGAGPVVQVGSTCRICPRVACPARREPTILSEG